MRHLKGGTRTAFLAFFTSHISFTLIMDSQAILPSDLIPQPMKDFRKWYTETYHDNLMTPPHDLFLKSFVLCELLFQLPFFFIATYALWSNKVDGRGWFRTACLIYGSHTATTLVPILATIGADTEITSMERIILFGFYLPYLVFPLWLVSIAARSEDVFGRADKGNKVR